MKIHLYAVLWNEAPLLPYFFRHYDQFVERYVMYDNGSTDGTLDMLRAHPRVEVRPYVTAGTSVCVTGAQLKSQCWKESRGQADLVIVCDVDELLWHPNLSNYLQQAVSRGLTLLRATGWQLVHPTFPTTPGQIYDEVKTGFRAGGFNKSCIFNPVAVHEINYSVGAHDNTPTGFVYRDADPELRLLHCKYLGVDYLIQRYAELKPRLLSGDLQHGWGSHYLQTAADLRKIFAGLDRLPLNLVPTISSVSKA